MGGPMNIDDLPRWHFGEDEETANGTLAQILDGSKRMTSSVYCYLEPEPGLPLEEQLAYPKVGDLNVITDWDGNPKCIVRTTDVRIMEYGSVPFEIARLENGDETLEDWQISRAGVFEGETIDVLGMADSSLDGYTKLFLEVFEVVEYL